MKIVMTTVSNPDDGEKLSRALVSSGYSPCVNMVRNVKSVYIWKGELNIDDEIILLIKTENEGQVIEFLKKNHPYETPEIIILHGDIPDSSYSEWFRGYFEGKRV
ncbi:divalent-cation tolerance protein CutA [Cuniculiplasma sp. SKW3]|uniref:divalent-cation tolerance protein CutA n=1 Tax=unclassified Cuniculiplasma TaxID=2619706 RepID=UPI003FD40B75